MASEQKLDEGSDAVVVQGGMKVAFNASGITVNVHGATITVDKNGTVAMQTAANDTAAKASLEIGAVALAGDHKGEIYGGIYPADNKPIWFSAAPRLMDHYKAAAWAEGQGGALPTRKQGDYLTTLKGKLEIGPAPRTEVRCLKDCPAKRDGPDGGGAFTELFNRGGSFPAGMIWLEDIHSNGPPRTWHQRLSDGVQMNSGHKLHVEVPVLCVIR